MDHFVHWRLAGKVLAGEATEPEQRQFDDWLRDHPDQQPIVDELRRFWATGAQPADSEQSAAAFGRLLQRLPAESRPQPVRRINPFRVVPWVRWAVAASVLLAVIWWFQQPADQPESAVVRQTNAKGIRSKIRLADGSVVWLNADSHLDYPKQFSGSLREVSLTGEAFFQVAHDPANPFVVRLKTGSVRVLGTSFNIRAYPDDSLVETSVVTGKVAFIPTPSTRRKDRPSATPDTLFVRPNVKVIQSLTSRRVVLEPTVVARQIAWTESKLVFQDTPLGEVAKTLERWYGTPVVLERESLRSCPLTGTFQNQSLREVMNLISLTNRFKYELSANQVTIKGIGCGN